MSDSVMALSSRVQGCLVGGAIGDAMGGAFEGQSGFKYEECGEWYWSDDAVLTAATGRALVSSGSVDPLRIAEEMVASFKAGEVRGVGASTLKALRDLDQLLSLGAGIARVSRAEP